MAVPSSVVPLLFGACAVSSLGTACSLDEEGVAVGFDAGRPDHGGSDARLDTTGPRETGHDVSIDVVADTSDVAPPVDAMPDVCSSSTLMSDPKNCGTCGHDCLGGACVTGQCQPKIIATTKMPQAIVVHTTKSGAGTTLYWTDVDPTDTPQQDVYSCSLPDCATATPSGSKTGCNMSLGVAVDATSYYFTCWTNSWFFACSSPTSCASTSPISTTTAMGGGVNNPSGILVDRGTVPGIFLLAQTNGGGMHTGGVLYEPLGDGGTPTNFQGGQNYPSGIAKVGAELFWTETAGNVVSSCSLSGSPPNCAGTYSQILPGAHMTPLPNPDQLAADATRIYFTSNGTMPMTFTDGVVFAASHDGTTLAPLATGQSYPRGIAIDADYVYWVDYVGAASTTGTVNRAPVSGGTVVTLASGLAAPVGITQDVAAVYWTNQGDGTISRLAK